MGAEWLVLAYLAGDNDLEGALLDDLREMERVGSRPGSVEILAQLDRAIGFDRRDGDWSTARRYYVKHRNGGRGLASELLADLGEVNTGDARVLKDFITFGARRFPARACALILGNHGTGFVVARSRGIAYDDGGDCLDNRELQRALAAAHRVLRRKVDLVGMDACLMTMIEVAYQIREHAAVLVGSEELEPDDGWPHDTILRELVRRPGMTGAELARTIVDCYVRAHATRRDVTQSAIDLAKLDALVAAIDQLAGDLLRELPDDGLAMAIHAAWRRSVRFFDNAYVDLHHLARNLARVAPSARVRRDCGDVMRAIEGPASPIIAAAHTGGRLAATRGLSIYFPPFWDSGAGYAELDFARRTRWGAFLETHLAT